MNITFEPLCESHFPLLLRWLETKHVKAWWDEDVIWTLQAVREKYSTYVLNYKFLEGIAKKIYAYIIMLDEVPIGYIQYYNKYDFPHVPYYDVAKLPKSCAGIDYYIGEVTHTGKGIGSKALSIFLEQYVFQWFEYAVVDPDTKNTIAIKTYEKAGFKIANEERNGEILLMIKNKSPTKIIYLIGKPGTGKYTISRELAKYGYNICDNQLINNPIFALLNYDGFTEIPEFAWEIISKIRDNVFDFIAGEPMNNYVLTNVLYDIEYDYQLFAQVEKMASKRGSLFIPVKLSISTDEHLKRITDPSRRDRWKSIDPKEVYDENKLINISHTHLVELDVSLLTAKEAAEKILSFIEKIGK